MLKFALTAAAASFLLGAPAMALANGMSLTMTDYNRGASARAARTWRAEAYDIAPQASEQAALNPYGPDIIASRPIPDTLANRTRFGEPMSRAGKLTAPIGD